MKSALAAILLVFAVPLLTAQHRCGTDYNPAPYRAANAEVEARNVYTLPVVVHIVWHSPEENISDEQVHSQIEVLNADFRAMNPEAAQALPPFSGAAADTEIEFCLVAITRTQTDTEGIATRFENGKRIVCHTELGGKDAVHPDRYINIWVAGREDGTLGSATFPQEGQEKPQEDGLFLRPDVFGTTGSVSPPYHLGRTATHEMGHYLNLQHPWGSGADNFDCSGDDGIADTPLQSDNYRNTCPSFVPSSCGTPDQFMNFMNYTEDACLALFTSGQAARMRSALTDFRPGLLQSSCSPLNTPAPLPLAAPALLQNPASGQLSIRLPQKESYGLAIFSPAGRLVWLRETPGGGEFSFPLPRLSSGFYYLKIKYGKKLYTKKLIIAR